MLDKKILSTLFFAAAILLSIYSILDTLFWNFIFPYRIHITTFRYSYLLLYAGWLTPTLLLLMCRNYHFKIFKSEARFISVLSVVMFFSLAAVFLKFVFHAEDNTLPPDVPADAHGNRFAAYADMGFLGATDMSIEHETTLLPGLTWNHRLHIELRANCVTLSAQPGNRLKCVFDQGFNSETPHVVTVQY